ncbi:serine hydrolase domain-containing protein [Alterisphingorhabdus coralli]|uniref:Serine hydrolase n=1 Tax=Alterisphingorhabdus coralli TaxID=3071408 RepID=A0AA97F6U1_9SPHN|nr:serine hydrolase [Parasphingorhabdus sp. SCSIO 66989]WOE75028.1 serine hydrolase [Parasphingorhabdus sp. SCSIO 66989]
MSFSLRAASLGLAATALAGGAVLLASAAPAPVTEKPAETAENADPIIDYRDGNRISANRLRDAVEPMFEAEEFAETRAIIIVEDGEIIAERYAKGYDRETRFISWSMAKTVTSVLIGILVSDGRLALDEPAPVPEWQRPGDPRGAITLRQLLHMSSGLDHTEAGDPPYESDEVRALFLDGAADAAGYAKAKTLEAQPGEQFEYSTNTSFILSDIITRELTDSTDPDVRQRVMAQFIKGRLTEPLGLTSMFPEYDAAGTMLGGSLIHATARDWAKFGEFLRNGGAVDGNQILPKSWIRFMLTSSEIDPAYAGHIWLNKQRTGGRNPVLFPNNGPDNVFAMLGHLGQKVIVSPDKRVTMVRLGKTQDEVGAPIDRKMGEILAVL